MKSFTPFFFASGIALAPLSAEPDGKQLFTLNCSACHQLQGAVVGPSLVEIRQIYNGKVEDFIKWSVAPEQKRPNAIQMPSMVHVGEEGLAAIYSHIMSITDGVKPMAQAGGQDQDPYASSPSHAARPQVQRMFLPNAGPAAIAVALDDENSLCWDAGSTRLRYAWHGGFIDGFPYWSGNGSQLAKLKGEVFYTEGKSPLPFTGKKKFHGYSVVGGLPTFRYRIGSVEISEAFRAYSGQKGFNRTFTISPQPTGSLVMSFPEKTDITYRSDKGKWSANQLTLDPSEAAEFTVTISKK